MWVKVLYLAIVSDSDIDRVCLRAGVAGKLTTILTYYWARVPSSI